MNLRSFIAINLAMAPAANLAAWRLQIDPEKKLNTFVGNAVPAAGLATVDATACWRCGRIPMPAAQAMLANVSSGHALPTLLWVVVNDDYGPHYMKVVKSSNPALVGTVLYTGTLSFSGDADVGQIKPGQALDQTVTACLTACGLQRRVVPVNNNPS